MLSKWTSNLYEEKEKESFEKEVQGSRRVLDRITALMQQDLEEINRADTSKKIYDTPAWQYLQAHNNGERGCLSRYLRLLDLDQRIELVTKG